MTTHEIEIYRSATRIYTALAKDCHCPLERARLRLIATNEAHALWEHVRSLDIHHMGEKDRVQVFISTLERHHGNLRQTARELGISERTASKWRNRLAPEMRRIRIPLTLTASSL